MALNSSGEPDFKNIVKTATSDIVTVSEGTSSMANKISFVTGEKTVASTVTAEVMPTQAIPDGFSGVIVAKPNNTTDVYYGHSQAEAELKTHALAKGTALTIKSDNFNVVWILPATSGEGVDYFVESD